jgi:hypothetical protein
MACMPAPKVSRIEADMIKHEVGFEERLIRDIKLSRSSTSIILSKKGINHMSFKMKSNLYSKGRSEVW